MVGAGCLLLPFASWNMMLAREESLKGHRQNSGKNFRDPVWFIYWSCLVSA